MKKGSSVRVTLFLCSFDEIVLLQKGPHVKAPVPEERGLGAAGVPKGWRAQLATYCRSSPST